MGPCIRVNYGNQRHSNNGDGSNDTRIQINVLPIVIPARPESLGATEPMGVGRFVWFLAFVLLLLGSYQLARYRTAKNKPTGNEVEDGR
jgi:hypothetical protein